MSDKSSFFAELKRRNVYKVAATYIVAGWALSQGIAQVFRQPDMNTIRFDPLLKPLHGDPVSTRWLKKFCRRTKSGS